MKALSLQTLVCCALLSFSLLSTGTSCYAQTGTTLPVDNQELSFLTLLNQFRVQNGVSPVQMSVTLENEAQWLSGDMATHNYLGYTDSLGRTPDARIAYFGYKYGYSEYLAEGFGDAQSIFNQWVLDCIPNSSGSCSYAYQNMMLTPTFKAVGIGRGYNSNSAYGWYWTITFGVDLDQLISPGSIEPPTIASFAAVPSTITAGQSGALCWNVAGATSVTINNGVGDVSTTTFKYIAPTQTTTYTLTATNAGGTVTANATVTVAGSTVITPPVVNTFASAPSTINAGQAAVLSWAVTGATAVNLNNGIGNVSNNSSQSVSPAQTTTYTLTASNSAGSTVANVTVTVTPAIPPPAAPTIIDAIAKSPAEVDLAWATDVSGVAGYQISRNGSVIGTVPNTGFTYADTTVSPATTYTYVVRAYNASNNYSSPTNTVQVSTPAASTTPSCPAATTNSFAGCYYANTTLSGSTVFTNVVSQLNLDWLSGFPSSAAPVVPNDFSVRWQGIFSFAQGPYTFDVIASDGIRLYIDGNKVLDSWKNQPPSETLLTLTPGQGSHALTVEFYDQTGSPTAHVSWQQN